MADIDRRTGAVIDDWRSVLQSLEILVSTRLGERVMREYVGSLNPGLLGRNFTTAPVLRFFYAMLLMIELWEPRFDVTRIAYESKGGEREGKGAFLISGQFMPKAHLGDYSRPGQRVIRGLIASNALRLLAA
jgi:phage baseplate assembly protein W